jgi:hypothetical protein
MAKRFTDTEKFMDPWYRRLPSKHKLLWEYMLCTCSHAGIVSLDLELVELVLKEKFKDDDLDTFFSDRLMRLSEFKYFIPKFIDFQYGKLNKSSKVHGSVMDALSKEGIEYNSLEVGRIYTLSIGYANTSDSIKDKDKNKAKAKVKDKAKEKEKASYQIKTQDVKTSPLESLNFLDVEIITWLREGSLPIQEKLLKKYDETYLANTIEKAFYWQSENKKRQAGTFLSSWVERDNNKRLKGNMSEADFNLKAFFDEAAARVVPYDYGFDKNN